MDPSEVNSLAAQEDAILLRSAEDVRFKLGLHTVPLFFLTGSGEIQRSTGNGSGVLVKLGARFFILTAGHCVVESTDRSIAVGITDTPHRFTPHLVSSGFRYKLGTEIDFGYWEVPAADVGWIKANGRVFLSEAGIEVITTEECLTRDDWMVLGGYPDELVNGDRHTRPGARLLGYSTILAGKGIAPPSRLTRTHLQYEVIDLWVPREGNIDATANPPDEIDVPALSGASGGGVWLGGVRPTPLEWSNSKMRLVGVHSGSCLPFEINGERHVFSREILLGHHLHLIATDYSDLREALLARWPTINSFAL